MVSPFAHDESFAHAHSANPPPLTPLRSRIILSRSAPCPRGKASFGGKASTCEACKEGKYAPFNTAARCMRCSAYRWTNGTGSAACDACNAGYYLANSLGGNKERRTWGITNGDDSIEYDHCHRDMSKGAQQNACCRLRSPS